MLEVQQLSKRFGSMQAVRDESFTVKNGEIMGLIGQNGAGKTTTFRMILNFLKPDQGRVLLDGHALTAADYNSIGYLPEERGLYPKMKVEDQIVYFAQLHGMKARDAITQLDTWMKRFDVKGKRTDRVKDLSKGNQQKVQLIATLIHMPKLVILDEPFSGLDPVNASVLEEGIRMMRAEGAAIIYSSHDMGNVEALSDHLIMLRSGEVVLNGTVDEIRDSFGRTKVYLESPLSTATLQAMAGVRAVRDDGRRKVITLDDPAAGQAIFTAATANGYIQEFSQQAPTLDEIFRIKAGAQND
ncbi:ABC transporter ATP-binding protein [Lacticaseibacillus songhuajiangensis]|jgi:ABC-2 type transport system ATP-binding protein|uniref:ABC transporter ATP-binding protein n=1 Tax=Lacticaseibacillus songhuajiangensis TaxID=1296539 RepID=UPI000F772BEB|nr:ABC transporter ATP-binding protein [Lacticaseibacillus songhuajiangensis]MCI1283852.1 ABC transporter ATP-binding protein [Lacticaseibacillus songhuajiangensis]